MRPSFIVIILFSFLSANTFAEKISFPTRCKQGMNTILNGLIGLKNKTVESSQNFKTQVKEEGIKRVFTKKRPEEELSQSYKAYFYDVIDPMAPNTSSKLKKSWYKFKKITSFKKGDKRITPKPFSGTFDAIERSIFRKRTLVTPIKFTASMGIGLVAFTMLDSVLTEKIDENIFNNAAEYALSHDYNFRFIKAKLDQKEITEDEALKLVKKGLKDYKQYFDLIRSAYNNTDPDFSKKIVLSFREQINQGFEHLLFTDLIYFQSQEFGKNSSFQGADRKFDKISDEEFVELFDLNHLKIFYHASLVSWFDEDYDVEELKENDPQSFEIYTDFINDPYTQKVISFQKNNPDKIEKEMIGNILAEDIEWKVRFAQLKALGVQMIGGHNEDGSPIILTLEDFRASRAEKYGY